MAQDLVMDFSQVETFEAIPVGWYDVEVAEARPGQSQAGNPKLTLRMKVLGGDSDGRTLLADLVLTGPGAWRTKQAVNALFGDFEGESYSCSAEDFVGARCEVHVTQRVWREEDGGDGTLRNNINRYRASEAAGEAAAEMANMFGAD